VVKPHYFLALFLFYTTFLSADILKENFITFDLNGTSPTVVVDFESDNLEKFIMIDTNKNDIISWKEIYAKQTEIKTFVLSHIDITADGEACALNVVNFEVYRRIHQSYIKLHLNLSCAIPKEVIGLKYNLFFDVDKDQKAFVKLSGTHVKPLIMSDRKIEVSLTLTEPTLWSSFVDFLIEGVWHIWIGFDHILFLLMLLIPAVYTSKYIPRERFTEVLKEILKITTAFTLAHSITLALSVTKVVTLDITFIEVAIALSVLFTALNNIFFFSKRKTWIIAFVFGLIHGFGFANVLHELLDEKNDFVVMLLGFNLGVELGQLAIVLALLPLLFFLRKGLFYKRFIMNLFSAMTAIIAFFWAIERI